MCPYGAQISLLITLELNSYTRNIHHNFLAHVFFSKTILIICHEIVITAILRIIGTNIEILENWENFGVQAHQHLMSIVETYLLKNLFLLNIAQMVKVYINSTLKSLFAITESQVGLEIQHQPHPYQTAQRKGQGHRRQTQQIQNKRNRKPNV